MNASPVVGDGVVYVPGSGDPGYVHAIDAATGEPTWSTDVGHRFGSSSPAVANGTVYVGGSDGRLRAIESTTGD